jgi:predicted MPP superfamily phosphohydrolase
VARDVASLARHTRSLQPRARSLPALSGGEWRRRALTAVALTAGLAGAALATWALWFEPRRLVVRRRTLRLPRWPDALDGLTVAVLSDLHAGAPHVKEDRIERLVARVNREAPDLVVLLGDVIDPAVKLGGWVAPEAVASRLAALRAPLGTLAVLGNHDWLHDGPRVGRALSDAGIRVLEDEAVRITHRA